MAIHFGFSLIASDAWGNLLLLLYNKRLICYFRSLFICLFFFRPCYARYRFSFNIFQRYLYSGDVCVYVAKFLRALISENHIILIFF